MGLPWIKVAVDLPDHPKLDVLEQLLGLWEGFGIAVINRLWCWTARLYPDGVIPQAAWNVMVRKCARHAPSVTGALREITPLEFVDALRESKLAVLHRGNLVLHDWDEFQSAHARKAEQNRSRQRAFREKLSLLSNAEGNAEVTPDVTHVTRLEESRIEESREDQDQERASDHVDPPTNRGHHREPWDPAILKAVQEALHMTDIDQGWGQFVGQSLQEPAEARHAASREFLKRRCAQAGKDWPYLISMIRNRAGLKTQPPTTFEAHAPDPEEAAAVDRELAEIRRRRL